MAAEANAAAGSSFWVTWTKQFEQYNLEGVFFLDKKNGWAVGGSGTVLATRDGGRSWIVQSSGTQNELQSVYFLDGQSGWLVGQKGTVLTTTDGGANWGPAAIDSQENLNDIAFADALTAWIVGDNGTLLVSRDGGKTWSAVKSGVSTSLKDVFFINAETGWAVGSNGVILATIDGGASWHAQPNAVYSDLARVFFISRTVGWVVGNNGTIRRTSDGGLTWTSQDGLRNQQISDVQFVDETRGFAIVDSGMLWTSDGGNSWDVLKSTLNQSLANLAFVDPSTGWAVGEGGTILVTVDGGQHWARQDDSRGIDMNDVFLLPNGLGWVVGDEGSILATVDGGKKWIRQASGTNKVLSLVHFADAKTGWVAGDGGLIMRTDDGGTKWRPQPSGVTAKLTGIDFANDLTGWVVGDGGTILATRDGGRSWERQSSGTTTNLNAVDFVDIKNGWAVGDSGTVLATKDGGSSWLPLRSETSGDLESVSFVDDQTGWAVGGYGLVTVTRDGGAHWFTQQSGLEGDFWYGWFSDVYFFNASTGWAVGSYGSIIATRDGGRHWSYPDWKISGTVNAIHFASPSEGLMVGRNGLMVRVEQTFQSPTVERPSAITSGDGRVTVSFHISSITSQPTLGIVVQARAGETPFARISKESVAPDASGNYSMTWSPTTFRIEKGSEVDYRVIIDDAGPELAPIEIGSYLYAVPEPWWETIWREHPTGATAVLAPFVVFGLYVLGFVAVLLISPARLARVGSIPENPVAAPAGNAAFVWSLVQQFWQSILLLWLCRNGRVRRAWIKQYEKGQRELHELGKFTRDSFIGHPELLDVWVETRAEKIYDALGAFEFFDLRKIYVPLPVRIGTSRVVELPRPEVLSEPFSRSRTVIGVIGSGGCGKSTLACAIARWVLDSDPQRRPAPHRLIPVFIVQDTTDLMSAVITSLREMLGEEDLPEDLVRALLAQKRLLVIIDALSEREAGTQAYITKIFETSTIFNAVLITSRSEVPLKSVKRTMIYPILLDQKQIVPFIVDYVARLENASALQGGRTLLQLGDRILELSESGGQATQVTPLLVKMFVDGAVNILAAGETLAALPHDIPGVFIDYLRRVHPRGSASGEGDDVDKFILTAKILAHISLGARQVPGDFSEQEARAKIETRFKDGAGTGMLDALVGGGVIEKRPIGGIAVLRFALDPVAEYLAAMLFIEESVKSDPGSLPAGIAEWSKIEGYPDICDGFLKAFATCYRVYTPLFKLPDVEFQWEEVSREA